MRSKIAAWIVCATNRRFKLTFTIALCNFLLTLLAKINWASARNSGSDMVLWQRTSFQQHILFPVLRRNQFEFDIEILFGIQLNPDFCFPYCSPNANVRTLRTNLKFMQWRTARLKYVIPKTTASRCDQQVKQKKKEWKQNETNTSRCCAFGMRGIDECRCVAGKNHRLARLNKFHSLKLFKYNVESFAAVRINNAR